MKRLAVLIILFVALSAGQVLRSPSSYKDGVKWEFGTNAFHGDVLARSNVNPAPAVPTVYKKELIAPIARREPVVTTGYKKPPVVPDVYKKSVIPTVYKKEPVLQNVHRQQSVIPAISKTHSVASNIYKSEPVVQNVYKQQAAVPIVRKTYPAVSNVYPFKSQPIQPVVYHQEPQDYVPQVLSVNLQKKVQHYMWNYLYNPHHAFVRGNVHVVPHN